jgi:hypothetical protein
MVMTIIDFFVLITIVPAILQALSYKDFPIPVGAGCPFLPVNARKIRPTTTVTRIVITCSYI